MREQTVSSECPDCGERFGWKKPIERSSGEHEVSLLCPECGTVFDSTRVR